jgi:ribosomal protein S18 acetylase RimI-like enzyme
LGDVTNITVKRAGDDASVACTPILRSVPEWFGIESSTLQYIEETASLPTWIAFDESNPSAALGFLTLKTHSPHAAEIHCIAVHKSHHGRGVGTALLHHVESHLRSQGVKFLQVKTLGPSKPNAEYARTTHFYESRGFARLEELTGLWPGLPTLILVKSL